MAPYSGWPIRPRPPRSLRCGRPPGWPFVCRRRCAHSDCRGTSSCTPTPEPEENRALTSPIPSDSAATHEQAGYRDLMLTLVSYPDRVPDQALHNAARLAARLGGQVTAVAPAVRVTAPRNRLADMLLNFKELVRTEEARSAENARSLADAFEAAARPLGVMVERRIEPVELFFEADRLAEDARTFDLAMVPYGKTTANDRSVAEAMLFHSGRPVLLVPDADPLRDEGRLETVAVAWDGGREAARALADATPLLTAAGQV